MDELKLFRQRMELRRYSPRTIKSYLAIIKSLAAFLKKPFSQMSRQDLEGFLCSEQSRGLSGSSLHLRVNALRTFSTLLGFRWQFYLQYSKKPKKLPVVLSREEIQRVLECVPNAKHRLMISLAYGAGLRVSEVVNLQAGDVDFERGVLHVKQAKGQKDRLTLLPNKLFEGLKRQIGTKLSSEVVFESERGGLLTTSTPQRVFARAVNAAGISKAVTFHSLRHSFATHLVERGTNLRFVQSLLGHSSVRTTQMYTQVANTALMKVESPLD